MNRSLHIDGLVRKADTFIKENEGRGCLFLSKLVLTDSVEDNDLLHALYIDFLSMGTKRNRPDFLKRVLDETVQVYGWVFEPPSRASSRIKRKSVIRDHEKYLINFEQLYHPVIRVDWGVARAADDEDYTRFMNS